MERLSGKMQLLKVLITRNTPVQEIRKTIEESEEIIADMSDMLDRE